MIVSVTIQNKIAWAWEPETGTPSTFVGDACHANARQIIAVLVEALEQARGQLGNFEVVDAVTNIGVTATKIDRNIPMSAMRDDNFCREHSEKSAIEAMLATGAISLKVGVVQKPYIALVTALHNDNVASL